jgi:hypothetical protein
MDTTRRSLRIVMISLLIAILLPLLPSLNFPLKLDQAFAASNSLVGTTYSSFSPGTADYYQGQKRLVNVGDTLFAFYYKSSIGVVYKTSISDGNTWSAEVSAQTGTITGDAYAWGLASTAVSGTNYVTLLYWNQSSSNSSNTNFYAKRGSVSGSTINWSNPTLLFTASNNLSCPGGTSVCAAAAAATDTNGNIFASFRWKPSGATNFSFNVYKSSDGGLTWSTSLTSGTTTPNRMDIALTKLSSGKMLLVIAKYESATLTYRVYNGATWDAAQFCNPPGWTANTIKHISADSNSTSNPFVAYVTGGNSSTLKVIQWTNNGASPYTETADSTLSHSLPSITITPNGVHIYSISNSKIYETKKVGSSWQAPINPFGTTFVSPNGLTAGISYPGALWRESSSPYKVTYGKSPITVGFFIPSKTDIENLASTFQSHNLASPDFGTSFTEIFLEAYYTPMDRHDLFYTVTLTGEDSISDTIQEAQNHVPKWIIVYDNEPSNGDLSTPPEEYNGTWSPGVSKSAHYANNASQQALAAGLKFSIAPSKSLYDGQSYPSEFDGLDWSAITSWHMQMHGNAGESQTIINNVNTYALPIKLANPSVKIYVSVNEGGGTSMALDEIENVVQQLRGKVDGIVLYGYTSTTPLTVGEILDGIGR